MKRFIIILFLFILLPAALFSAETCRLIRVVDGDTIIINYNGSHERIRLIGIDTPESGNNPKTRRDAERSKVDINSIIEHGKKATAFVEQILLDEEFVLVEFDVQKRDRYKRLLGYVYLQDGRMLNEMIVRSGYASLMTIPPNVKYKDRFLKAYRAARDEKLGLWE